MVRVWLRPALAALGRQAARNAAVNAGYKQALMAQQQTIALRLFSSKKDKSHEKKSLHDKFVDVDEDLTEVPPEVEFLAKEELELERLRGPIDDPTEFLKASGELVDEDDDDEDEDDDLVELDEDELKRLRELVEGSEDDDEDLLDEDDEDDEGAQLTDAEWAAKYERELASIESGNAPEDDRLYIEMPNYDSSLSMAIEGDADDDDDDLSSDPFGQWDQGSTYSPEMLNWMTPREKRQPFGTKKDKPWKYFVRANHPDPVELAMDVDLLRLFISPTGRIRPRRFTGLTAKQQRQLARAVKISRQLALLPYLSRYPDPSPEQWRAMEEEEIAKLEALAENEDANAVDDDDDDDEFDDMDEE